MSILNAPKSPKCISQKVSALLECAVQWVIVDAAICPEAMWQARAMAIPMFTLFNQHDTSLAEKGPWLIAIEENAALITSILKKDPFDYGTLWLCSLCDPYSLVRQLQNRIYAALPSGGITRFRFFDTRVLHVYLQSLLPERRFAFLSPLSDLIYAPFDPFEKGTHFIHWQRQLIDKNERFQQILLPFENDKEK